MENLSEIRTSETEAEVILLRLPEDKASPPQSPPPPPTKEATPSRLDGRRKRGFRAFALFLLLGGFGYGGWRALFAGNSVSTDNAYVAGDVAMVTPVINGQVREVRVTETQAVKAGDILVILDGSDASALISQARAEEQQAERKVTGLIRSDVGFRAQIDARRAEVGAAQARVTEARAALSKTEQDLRRRGAVLHEGAISGEEYTTALASRDQARASLSSATAALASAAAAARAAQGSLAANHALVEGSSVGGNPEVLAANARLRLAQNELSRTVLRAPFDGVVARKQVQIGQRVQAGANLMTIVPLDKLYVTANFKETQIRAMAVGQSVRLTSDRYGSKVEYLGHVAGFSGGTGAAFAAIPAQNATGNWIKVVQRVPVKITLDHAQLKSHPLLIGLSMAATVDLAQ